MAVATINRPALKPLTPIELALYPLLKTIQRGPAREVLSRRYLRTQRIIEYQHEHKKMLKVLKKETKLYGKSIIDCWTRLGEAHMARHAHIATEGKPVKRKRGKVKRVKFSRIFVSPECIYFQILVNQKTLFGSKNALPFDVWVSDLTAEKTCQELGFACERKVTARIMDARKGAWIVVHRLEGVDGIPLKVMHREMLAHYDSDVAKAPVVLGVGKFRTAHKIDFASHPHWLVAGSTQGGKSNMVNHIICSLMRFSSPNDLKFILIDLKRLEFGFYENAPHLFQPIIFEAPEALAVLNQMIDEILARRTLFSQAKCKELAAWNKKFPNRRMPRLFVVVDEFAELMYSDVADEIGTAITRLTNLGRAFGVHLLLATQRPDSQVMPGKIRINMTLVISARVPNYHQSIVILGSREAADLPETKGRMLYLSGANLVEFQAPFIPDEDVEETVAIARGRAAGLINLEGAEPTVNPAGVVHYIVDQLDGWLNISPIWAALKVFAVPKAGLKALLLEIMRNRTVDARERSFEVQKVGRALRLVEIQIVALEPLPEAEVVEPVAEIIEEPEAAEEPVPEKEPVIVRIEAINASSEPIQEPAIETEPDPAPEKAVEPELTVDEQISKFIREYCLVGRTCSVTAKAIYRAYCKWCEVENYLPMTAQKLGALLKERGYKAGKNPKGQRAWFGIGLTDDIVDEPNSESELSPRLETV